MELILGIEQPMDKHWLLINFFKTTPNFPKAKDKGESTPYEKHAQIVVGGANIAVRKSVFLLEKFNA